MKTSAPGSCMFGREKHTTISIVSRNPLTAALIASSNQRGHERPIINRRCCRYIRRRTAYLIYSNTGELCISLKQWSRLTRAVVFDRQTTYSLDVSSSTSYVGHAPASLVRRNRNTHELAVVPVRSRFTVSQLRLARS